MILKNNPYLEQLIRDCTKLSDNMSDWIETDNKGMIEEIIQNITDDIKNARSYI